MQPLEQISIGEVLTYLRDITIAGVVLRVGWVARDFWQEIKDTKSRIFTHMTIVEDSLETLLTNHLPHLEEAIRAGISKDSRIGQGDNYSVDSTGQQPLFPK